MDDIRGEASYSSSESIGFHISHQLALKSATVYVGARSNARAEEGIKGLLSLTPSLPKDRVKTFVAELSDFKEVKSACERFSKEEPRLDLLIHNAGLSSAKPGPHGLSMNIAVNHIAPFIITQQLLPVLKATAAHFYDVRVVSLSSYAYKFFTGPTRFDTKESLSYKFPGPAEDSSATVLEYAHSKLANILFARELQKKLDQEQLNIISLSVHPGAIRTVGAIEFTARAKMEHVIENSLAPLEGAITPLFAATAAEVRKEKAKFGGAYIMPFGVVGEDDMSDDAKNDALTEKLWKTSEKVVDEIFANQSS